MNQPVYLCATIVFLRSFLSIFPGQVVLKKCASFFTSILRSSPSLFSPHGTRMSSSRIDNLRLNHTVSVRGKWATRPIVGNHPRHLYYNPVGDIIVPLPVSYCFTRPKQTHYSRSRFSKPALQCFLQDFAVLLAREIPLAWSHYALDRSRQGVIQLRPAHCGSLPIGAQRQTSYVCGCIQFPSHG